MPIWVIIAHCGTVVNERVLTLLLFAICFLGIYGNGVVLASSVKAFVIQFLKDIHKL